MIHQLKIKSEYFEDVVSRKKPFEIRFNDRGFETGDHLGLNEVDNLGKETGRWCLVKIEYILGSFNGLQEGWVCMSISPCIAEDDGKIKVNGKRRSV